MKIPATPPTMEELREEFTSPSRFLEIWQVASSASKQTKYLHWQKLRYRKPPGDLNPREWWFVVKLHRQGLAKTIPWDVGDGKPFHYVLADPIPKRLHEIDLQLGGAIGVSKRILNAEGQDQYLMRSLTDEAITSSQLEGARTSLVVAREMIRSGRKPDTLSEKMILNNFNTMKSIAQYKKERLSPELVLEIHRSVTQGTLDKPDGAGRLRFVHEHVVVDDMYGQVFHKPPSGDQLEQRLAEMCEFANTKNEDEFLHPVIRSIILHFWLAYIHPFVDGNGRTARALFYWSMLHQNYWLCEYLSISEIIHTGPSKYGMAFLYTETDDNDLTYFILYHLDVIHRAIKQLDNFVKRKERRIDTTNQLLRGQMGLNSRQRALLGHALRHPGYIYTIKLHRSYHSVVNQTARTDLHELVDRELLTSEKVGRTWNFRPIADLEQHILEFSS